MMASASSNKPKVVRALRRAKERCTDIRDFSFTLTAGLCLSSGMLLFAEEPVAWRAEPGYRVAELKVPALGKTGFTRLSARQTGITFTNHLSKATVEKNRILEIGSGVAAGDLDGDGWCDLYFCRLEGPNVLYRNLGNWRFEDITEWAGVACCLGQHSTGAVFADVDGDGDLDLLVNSLGGGTRLFLNDGHGRFTESTSSGLLRKFGSTSMALADIDGDGDLDLYVANYRTTTIRDSPADAAYTIKALGDRLVVQPADRFHLSGERQNAGLIEKGEPDVLYLNDGHGHFTPISWTSGAFLDNQGKPLTAPPQGWGLSVMFRDMNGDGAPDIYVCNDFFYTEDDIWINEGQGRFRAIPNLAVRQSSWSSMAVDFADINRDGFDDFIVVDMLSRDHARRQTQRANPDLPLHAHAIGEIENRPQTMRNTMFLNRGDGTYAEIAQLSGVEASEWSWSVIFLDVDLDGFEDLLVTTGNLHDHLDADAATRNEALMRNLKSGAHPKTLLNFPHLETPSLAFRNRGDLTFEESGRSWGFEAVGVSNGMALADLDNDGDLDVVVNNLNSTPGIYRNETVAPRLAVRLRGQPPNTQGIGAKIKVSGGPVQQSQEMICGGRYLSGDDPLRVFAAGSLTNRLTIEVTWRNGQRSVVSDARPNRLYEIEESGAAGRRTGETEASVSGQRSRLDAQPSTLSSQPIFQDVSHLLHHMHHDEPYNVRGPQQTLPNRLSELGPGVSWFDLDGDGWDDLVIGSGHGGELAVFFNQQGKSFQRFAATPILRAVAGDQTTVLGWTSVGGTNALLVGQSNYEGGGQSVASAVRFDYGGGNFHLTDRIPGQTASVGPMAVADIDGDGDLDLFVGSRVVPGRYPVPPTSRLFRNVNGEFQLDLENSRRLSEVGLVSGAVFSDLDGDGGPDLILACEWGPVRIFKNEHGKLQPWNPSLVWPDNDSLNSRFSNLNSLTSWWNGVTTGDFDGDGRLDIIATNWGRNTKYQRHRARPLRLFYSDFNEDGLIDVFESYFDRALNKNVPWRDLASAALEVPNLRKRFPTYRTYSVASVEEILGDQFATAKELQANWLESTLFLNRADHFEARVLPVEAQMAPAFGVSVGDFDGDGQEDIFLSQNFFATQPETSRYDAGRGLWLRGDGHGGFAAVPGQESGVLVYGEQRGCALADYDADGRVDLVVAQNGAMTKLYRNMQAKPGLRVRLKGGPNNPTGVGACVRLKFGDRFGPAREVHGGSGYWSQDSAVQVMGSSQPPTGLWVTWPGGRITTGQIPSDAKEITIDTSGRIRRLK